MKITLTDENGKSIQLNIADEEYSKLFPVVKKTGYERVDDEAHYYYICFDGRIELELENGNYSDKIVYDNANYYSDRTIAENNARADKLMRQLRRFAVEHREKKFDWNNEKQMKYSISYGSMLKLGIARTETVKRFGGIYFDTEASAQLAIDTFKNELLWYFTEYKDSL